MTRARYLGPWLQDEAICLWTSGARSSLTSPATASIAIRMMVRAITVNHASRAVNSVSFHAESYGGLVGQPQ